MATFLALLRAVNVGGHTPLPMAELRSELARAGYEKVRTLLQSGNVVFRPNERSGRKLETALEALLEKRFRVTTDVVVRSAAEWSELVRRNPFPQQAIRDPAFLHVVCLKRPPAPGGVDVLRAAIRGRESVALVGSNAYVVYPDGSGTSKLTISVIERALESRGTARNWNTVRKLDGLANP
jgi:uncharacterized protein (DUF1697 family)